MGGVRGRCSDEERYGNGDCSLRLLTENKPISDQWLFVYSEWSFLIDTTITNAYESLNVQEEIITGE